MFSCLANKRVFLLTHRRGSPGLHATNPHTFNVQMPPPSVETLWLPWLERIYASNHMHFHLRNGVDCAECEAFN